MSVGRKNQNSTGDLIMNIIIDFWALWFFATIFSALGARTLTGLLAVADSYHTCPPDVRFFGLRFKGVPGLVTLCLITAASIILLIISIGGHLADWQFHI